MEIKPIETRYAGCRFRSRLEARWAVVFDHLEIQWQYEPQGFEIPGGGRYLPDFWLASLGLWAEVKGRFAEGEWAELIRAVEDGLPQHLDYPSKGQPRLVLLGQIPQYGAALHPLLMKSEGDVLLRWCTLDTDMYYLFSGPTYRPLARVEDDPDPLLLQTYIPTQESAQAYLAGRSARFEFGESG